MPYGDFVIGENFVVRPRDDDVMNQHSGQVAVMMASG